LVENKYVACKLHGLNAQWSEEKKQSYIRHAIREYNIHKTLVHTNIVRLWDIFEIDHNTFCTVLEYCSGIIYLLDSVNSVLSILLCGVLCHLLYPFPHVFFLFRIGLCQD
jgi:serine/threonine protein kinase